MPFPALFLFLGFKSSSGNLRGVTALTLSCGWGFFQRAFLQIWDDLFFFWTMGRNQSRKTKPGWNSECSCELQQFPLNSELFSLLSSGIRSLSALYSSPLMFSWPKTTALLSLSQRIYSLVWHSQKFNFYTPAWFPTAFSSLWAISCCTTSVPHVFVIEEGSWAPLRKAEFFRVSAGVIWNALSAFLHSSSQFRNVLCMWVCHICQLHVVVWNILKCLKHCWIPTCDGCSKLWSSFEQRDTI